MIEAQELLHQKKKTYAIYVATYCNTIAVKNIQNYTKNYVLLIRKIRENVTSLFIFNSKIKFLIQTQAKTKIVIHIIS